MSNLHLNKLRAKVGLSNKINYYQIFMFNVVCSRPGPGTYYV